MAWIKKNGKWVDEQCGKILSECTCNDAPPRKIETRFQATKPAAKVSAESKVHLPNVEVRLFEAIRDTHLALSEFRIALELRLSSLPEKIGTLRKQLDLLETLAFQSDANIIFCMSTKRAVSGLRQHLAVIAPDPIGVSRASKELREILGYLERREPHTDTNFMCPLNYSVVH